MSELIVAKDLSKTYVEGKLTTPVLKGVDMTISHGQTIAIVGKSGSGKSTLMHMLGGVDTPTDGAVLLKGHDLSACSANRRARLRNQHLGFVYQFHHLLPEFTALENVAMPLLMRKVPKSEVIRAANDMLEKVGLSDRLHHKSPELSGGERQRVALARALVTKPDCVLADEPTGNLDQQTAADVMRLIQAMREVLNTTFVIVTHDMSIASQMDHVYLMEDGRCQLSG